MSQSFIDQMAIVRDRIASRGQKVNIGTAPEPARKVERFNVAKPAKKKAPTSSQLNERWRELLAKEIESTGCDCITATSIVAKKHPALRQRMIEAANRERVSRR